MATHGRRISSLSVTYQEEFHRPTGPKKYSPPITQDSSAKLPSGRMCFTQGQRRHQLPQLLTSTAPSTTTSSSYLSLPVPPLPADQSLVDICEEFGNNPEQELLQQPPNTDTPLSSVSPSFYPPPNLKPTTVSQLPFSTQQGNGYCSTSSDCSLPTCTTVSQPNWTHQAGHERLQVAPLYYSSGGVDGYGVVPPQGDVPPSWTGRSQLHDLEDRLRYKVNVQIEEFRLSIQQILNEQFHELPTTARDHVHQSQCNTSGIPSSAPNNEQVGEDHDTGSVYSNEVENTSYSDSGISHQASPQHSRDDIEQQIDMCLIQLQTYSQAMTTTLCQRAEFSVAFNS